MEFLQPWPGLLAALGAAWVSTQQQGMHCLALVPTSQALELGHVAAQGRQQLLVSPFHLSFCSLPAGAFKSNM